MLFLPIMAMPDTGGQSGDGPGDPDGSRRRIRAHVLIAVAFGLAMAFTAALFFLIFHFLPMLAPDESISKLCATFVPNFFLAFLYGLIFGTFIAFVYNGLVTHHFNVFNVDAEDYA